eukprot:365167-Chlamydomonas_euryale.AAC.1
MSPHTHKRPFECSPAAWLPPDCCLTAQGLAGPGLHSHPISRSPECTRDAAPHRTGPGRARPD